MPRPIILLEQTDGDYWDRWMDFFNSMMVEQGFADKSDMNLVYKALTVEQAIDHIINYYKVFHSLRYVGDLTILRLTKSLPSAMVKDLNHEFQDIILKGSMRLSPPHKLEIKNNEFLELPRLSLHFIKSKYGRLNQLIEAINKA